MSGTATEAALTGSTVLVTGGSRGIGLACAQAAVRNGASVVICARNPAELDAAAAQLTSARPDAAVFAQPCNVADAAAVDRLIAAAIERFGALHGVVHAAAVIGPIGPTVEVDPVEWFDAVRINLMGTLLIARATGRVMRRQGRGRIVLLSGGGATSPFPNYSAYACSKAAVVRLTETLAHELAPHGVSVNALAPGFVATGMHDATLAAGERAGADYLQRTRAQLAAGGASPDHAAAAAVFLLSAASDGITGRLLAAVWDDWRAWPAHAARIAASDLFTLRRIVPADRGMAWE